MAKNTLPCPKGSNIPWSPGDRVKYGTMQGVVVTVDNYGFTVRWNFTGHNKILSNSRMLAERCQRIKKYTEKTSIRAFRKDMKASVDEYEALASLGKGITKP